MSQRTQTAHRECLAQKYQEFKNKKVFTSLDGLRFLSIFWVCVLHYATETQFKIVKNGAIGVQLFFGISGFLITTLMIREREDSGEVSLSRFYIRRTFRILPLYYLVLLTYLFIVITARGSIEGSERFLVNFPAFATFTSNWFVEFAPHCIFFLSWSLATEEQFYLSWPWIERALRTPQKILLLVASIPALYGVKLDLLPVPFGQSSLAWKILNSIQPTILMGVVSAHLLNNQRAFGILWKLFGRKWVAPVSLAALVALASNFIITSHKMPINNFEVWAHVALMALVVSCVIREDNGLQFFLTLQPIARIGTVSYGVYLMNMLALHVARKIAGAFAIRSLWFVCITAGVIVIFASEMSFRTFERYFMNLRNRVLEKI